jgi:transposase-like protein
MRFQPIGALMDIYRKIKPKEKPIRGRPPQFTNEFMQMVARKVVDEGMTYQVAAKTFKVSQGSVGKWVTAYRQGSPMSVRDQKSRPSDELIHYRLEEQVKDLKREIGELYLENLMLKKALYHSQSVKKENSSVITSENLDQFQRGVE